MKLNFFYTVLTKEANNLLYVLKYSNIDTLGWVYSVFFCKANEEDELGIALYYITYTLLSNHRK